VDIAGVSCPPSSRARNIGSPRPESWAVAELLKLKPALPLAVISANHQVEVVTRAREVGATFLQKPLTDKAMGEFLDAAADRLATQ